MKLPKTLICLLFPLFSNYYLTIAQVVVDGTKTPQQLVQDVLLGAGITVSNISYTGDAGAIGFFNGTYSNVGLDSGIVLTSGSIATIPGPNNSSGAGSDNGMPGDADLDNISAAQTHNAAILEFDFIPTSEKLKFKYVFGSEEYLEYVNSGFNDVFGFFISGPGISGAPNIALIPGTNTPVTIDNVNDIKNSSYYFNNENPIGLTVQYDGFTVVLEAEVDVIACQTYHIKLAVADAGDGILDSGVFLEAGSFESGIDVNFNLYGAAGDSSLYEGCSEAEIILSRSGMLDSAESVVITIGGTASNGVDYSDISDTVYFAPGQDSVLIYFSTILDNLTEGTETITIQVSSQTCGDSSTSSLTITIVEASELIVSSIEETNICVGDSIMLSADVEGGIGAYQIEWENLDGENPYVSPEGEGTYIVHVTDSCGRTGSDTVHITELEFISGFSTVYNSLNNVNFNPAALSGGSGTVVFWDFGDGNTSIEENPNHEYQEPGQYQVMLVMENSLGCLDTSYVMIDIYEDFMIANTFTPNNDNINDEFVIPNVGLTTYSLKIYNRWGSLLFESTDPDESWNGKTKIGSPASSGTYFYVLDAISPFNDFSTNGTINLIRN
jgi:gliding motility-associated-like protein